MTQPYVDLDAYDSQKLAEAQALEQAQAAAAKVQQAEAAANVATPPVSAEFDADAYAAAQQGAPAGGPVKVAIVPTTAATVQAGPAASPGGGTQDKYAAAPLAPKYLGTVQSGGGYTPAHEVQAVGPTTLEAFKQERGAQAAAVEGYRNAALSGAMQAAVARDEAQKTYDEHAKQAAEDQEAARRSREEYTAKLKAVSDEGTRLAQEKIDPKRFWANSSTGSQIAMGLGAIFSGALAGFQGRGGNDMLDRIDRMIDRDVQSQVDSYNARAKSVEARRSMYGQLLQQTHGDENAAKAILRDAQTKKVMAMSEYAAAASKSAEMMAKAAEVNAHFAASSTERISKMMPYVQASSAPVKRTHVMRLPNGAIVEVNDAQAVSMAEKDADRDLKASEQLQKRAEAQDKNRDLVVHLPNGEIRAANSRAEAESAGKRAVAYKNIDTAFQQATALRQEIAAATARGQLTKANAARTQLQRLGLTTAKTIENAQEQGVLREGEVKDALNLTTGFTAMQPGSDESLQRGRAMFAEQFATMSRTLLPHKVTQQIVEGRPVYAIVPEATPESLGAVRRK